MVTPNEVLGTVLCVIVLLIFMIPALTEYLLNDPKKPMVIDHSKKREDMDCVEKFLDHYNDTRMWKGQDPHTFIQNNTELKGHVYYYGIVGKTICTRFVMRDSSKIEIVEYTTPNHQRLVRRVYEIKKGNA